MSEDWVNRDITNECPFCRCSDAHGLMNFHKVGFNCPFCGNFSLSSEVCDIIFNAPQGPKLRAMAAGIAQERKLNEQDKYHLILQEENGQLTHKIIEINGYDFLSSYPEDFLKKIDRILLNIGHKTHFSPVESYTIDFHDFGMFFILPRRNFYKNKEFPFEEIEYIKLQVFKTIRTIEDMGLIERDQKNQRLDNISLHLTVKGLERLQKLRERKNKQQAFVAMWFSQDMMLKTYWKELCKAIKSAGYPEPYRVDNDIYNGPIVNKIINQIKESRFLIADLTCDAQKGMRGGVYYEAGLAEGLGMPVILTCNKKAFDENLVHFDLKQFNIILWETDSNGKNIKVIGHEKEDFAEYVKEWIIRSVGKGLLR